MTIGSATYSQAALLNIFNTAPLGDPTYILIHQLIAAKLNIAQGADASALGTLIADADRWLSQYPLGSNPGEPAATTGISYANRLDDFNNGVAGPGHCGLPTATPTLTRTPTATSTPTATATETSTAMPTETPAPTDTPEPVSTPVPTATSDGTLPGRYEYTCQAGPATDSVSGDVCADNYSGTIYDYEAGSWWLVRTYCMTKAQCERPDGPPLEEYKELPCVPKMTTSGIVLECKSSGEILTWNVRAETLTTCPVNKVIRAPYPRTMVNVDTNFMLEPQEYNNIAGYPSTQQSPANLGDFIDGNGNPTEHGYQVGIWKDLQLIMRSRRFNGGETWGSDRDLSGAPRAKQIAPKPQWIFADRDWNTGPYSKVQEGQHATYLYQTSSADLNTVFGRSFDMVNKVPGNDYNLPAYGVTVKTFCGHEWKVVVKIATRKWQPTSACFATVILPDGKTFEPDGTSNQGCEPGFVSNGSWTYAWMDFATEWAGIDLRDIGRATSYDVRTRTISGGLYKDQEYWDEPVGVWVPVVEVQSVLRDQCVAAGSCAPPKAPTATVAP
jgi:hypothetical protein